MGLQPGIFLLMSTAWSICALPAAVSVQYSWCVIMLNAQGYGLTLRLSHAIPMSYRTMRDRSRYRQHCLQHLEILDLLEKKENSKASGLLRQHLQLTLDNLGKIQLVP